MFLDRTDAGRQLAQKLKAYTDDPGVLVLGLPRGGVPVAFEVAQELHAPLGVLVVRKLGVPGHEELAMGAVASPGVRFLNRDVINRLGISRVVIDSAAAAAMREVERQQREYCGEAAFPSLAGRTVIVVDDGLATGSTMRAAVQALRQSHPAQIVVAVPVAAPDTAESLRKDADEVVCVDMPDSFYAVGVWYERFTQISDEEVRRLLDAAAQPAPSH